MGFSISVRIIANPYLKVLLARFQQILLHGTHKSPSHFKRHWKDLPTVLFFNIPSHIWLLNFTIGLVGFEPGSPT